MGTSLRWARPAISTVPVPGCAVQAGLGRFSRWDKNQRPTDPPALLARGHAGHLRDGRRCESKGGSGPGSGCNHSGVAAVTDGINGGGIVRRSKNRRARHQCVGAGINDAPGIAGLDAAVHLNPGIQATFVTHLAQCADLLHDNCWTPACNNA